MSSETSVRKPKVAKLIISVIEDICFSGRQSQEYKFIAKITKGEVSHKIKIHIDRDTYDFQSSAIAYVWKPLALEWSVVASIPYKEMKTGKYAANSNSFVSDKNKLLTLLEEIIF